MKSTCQQRGFTLIEMMITVAVLTIVLGTVVTYISRLQRVYKTQETNVDSTDEGRMFLDNIERELHTNSSRAERNSAPVAGPTTLASAPMI